MTSKIELGGQSLEHIAELAEAMRSYWRAGVPFPHSSQQVEAALVFEAIPAALLAAEQRGREAERALLDTFGKNTGLELSWGEIDPTDEGGPCAWLVHERRGNVNDREWHLIAHGDTPAEAIAAAIRKGEGT